MNALQIGFLCGLGWFKLMENEIQCQQVFQFIIVLQQTCEEGSFTSLSSQVLRANPERAFKINSKN
jgi:hypothetical protein